MTFIFTAWRELKEPRDYFSGVGDERLPTPTQLLLFERAHKNTLQQESLRNRSHARFVLAICAETAGNVQVDHRSLSLRPGQALLIHPHQFHHYTHLAAQNLRWLFCTFELEPSTFLNTLRDRVMTIDRLDAELLEKLAENRSENGPEEEAQVLLLQLLLRLKHAASVTESTHTTRETDDGLPRAVNRALEENRGRVMTVEDLAVALAIPTSSLRANFKKTAGVPIGAYLRNYRVHRAMTLLHGTDLPIAEIATEAGFGSPQAFSRFFRREVGRTPRAYRAHGADA